MLYYKMTREDFVKPKDCIAKVLQTLYRGGKHSHAYPEFRKHLDRISLELCRGKISLEEANRQVRTVVILLEAKYPTEFPPIGELGWYSKQILIDKFWAGEVIVGDTYTSKELLREKTPVLEALQRRTEEAERKKQEEAVKEQERLIAAELTRVPVKVGMLFKSKEGLAKAFKELYPEDVPLSAIKKELGQYVTTDYGKHGVDKGYLRQCTRVLAVLEEGGRAWQEDLV